jgi:hypothetical protein
MATTMAWRLTYRMANGAGYVGLALVASGCFAPEPVIRMTPMSEHLFWVQGTQVAAAQGKTGRAAVAFLRDGDSHVSFRVELENTSAEPVLVDPATFYYRACYQAETPEENRCSPSQWVIDPEQVLLDLDVQRSRASASNKSEAAFFTPFIMLDTVLSLGGLASRDPLTHAARNSVLIDDIKAKEGRQNSTYLTERSLWETGAFRKSTLFPGQRASGMVFIPRDVTSNTVRLNIRIGEEIIAFPFKQSLYQVSRRSNSRLQR